MCDYGESTEHFLLAEGIFGLVHLIQTEDVRHNLWVYRGAYGRNKLPAAPSEVAKWSRRTWMLFTVVIWIKATG